MNRLRCKRCTSSCATRNTSSPKCCTHTTALPPIATTARAAPALPQRSWRSTSLWSRTCSATTSARGARTRTCGTRSLMSTAAARRRCAGALVIWTQQSGHRHTSCHAAVDMYCVTCVSQLEHIMPVEHSALFKEWQLQAPNSVQTEGL